MKTKTNEIHILAALVLAALLSTAVDAWAGGTYGGNASCLLTKGGPQPGTCATPGIPCSGTITYTPYLGSSYTVTTAGSCWSSTLAGGASFSCDCW